MAAPLRFSGNRLATIFLNISGYAVTTALVAAGMTTAAPAKDRHLFDGDSFEAAVESLSPGDTLIVHAGTYADPGRINIQVRGTETQSVVIRAAAGEERPLITRLAEAHVQNTINVEGATHLTLSGFEISGNGGDGIRITDGAAHVMLDNLVIHDIAVGINFKGNLHDITVRGNHIYRTSRTGEGMYVGCNYGKCVVSNTLIEGNWIHDTQAAEQGDGIEIKLGSHSNIVRNNVIHDTNWPCILLYGTSGEPRNIVEGNVMWNCGDSGIQAAADATIRNNIILDSPGNGFNSQPHQGVNPANLSFIHNTVVRAKTCLRLRGWSGAAKLVFSNNAVYCDRASTRITRLSGVAASGNVFTPAVRQFPTEAYSVGRDAAADFVDIESRRVFPTADSPLRGAANPEYAVPEDFNGNTRSNPPDAGAYAYTGGGNPGWRIEAGFKVGKKPSEVIPLQPAP